MKYTAIINNRSYDLPPKTMAVAEKLDEAMRVDVRNDLNIRAKYQMLFDAVNEILGHENAEKALGGSDLENIDLADVTLAFRIIVDAYDRPVADYVAKRTRDKLAASNIEQIVKLAHATKTVCAEK